jgi:Putative Flp pilus-assembly TadE/G-like
MPRLVSQCACCLRRCKSLRHLREFHGDRSGAVLIYTALALAVLLGFGGLAVDAGMWYATKRSAQTAADAAAIAGALEVARGSTSATVQTKAKDDAERNGYSAATGATITINNPPTSGPSASVASAVEAIVQQPVPGFLSAILHEEQVTVAARAVARSYVAESCVYVMNPSANAALSVPGTAAVDMDCGAQVNSDSPTAINQTGASCMTATQIATTGGASGTCLNPQPDEDMPRVEDPFSYLTPPAAATAPCDYTSLVQVTSPTTLNPGNYCGGLKIEANVTFNPGEYVLNGQGLQIQGNSVVTGDEVSFYFPDTVTGYDPPGPTPPRSLYVAGTTDVHLTAPTSGDYQSILFYNDPNVAPNIEMWVQGGANMDLTGVIYASNNHLRFAGGSGGVGGWTVLAVDTLEFTGNSNISGSAPPVDLPLALIRPTLVE